MGAAVHGHSKAVSCTQFLCRLLQRGSILSKILIIEDDAGLAAMERSGLEWNGYTVSICKKHCRKSEARLPQTVLSAERRLYSPVN